jgi:hypothetical protein
MSVLENMVLRSVFGPKRGELTGDVASMGGKEEEDNIKMDL